MQSKKKRMMIMATRVGTFDASGAVAAESRPEGFFARIARRVMKAQEAKARRIVYRHLATFSNERLVDLGFDPAEIERIRASGDQQLSYWA